jgi:hypothetical protein
MADRSETDGEHRPPYRPTGEPPMTTEDVAYARAMAEAAPAGAGRGARLIAEERLRQKSEEGWTPEHDDEHDKGELAAAARAYLYQANAICEASTTYDDPPIAWPWHASWWKPSDDPIRNLVKAGALIAAEIDRLQRSHNGRQAAEG